MIGRTLGNYRIIEQIGLGGMATVFKGYDPDTDRYVAIKILPQHFSADPQFRERFQREAKAIAKLEHLHILPIFAYGEEDGIAYMVMRYLPAGTLSDRISRGALPFAEAGRILSQLAGALDHAHANGILHRDMKPSNVLLDDDGNAYLMDFGIAKIVEATVDLTGDRLLGTPAYMSPEQCKGIAIGPASDIYSLGIILYEMMTGRRPFHAETPVAVIMQQLNDPLPPPHDLRPDLPPRAEMVIFKALAKNPESRYKTAGELANAFNKAVARAETAVGTTRPVPAPVQESEPALAASPGISSAPAKRPLPAWAWGLIGVVAAAVLIIGGFLLANRSGAGQEDQLANLAEATQPETAVPAADSPATALPTPFANEVQTTLHFIAGNQSVGSAGCGKPAVGDLNGDALPDIFIAQGNGFSVWLNAGSGMFIKGNQVEDTNQDEQLCANHVALGDLDGDGDMDALVGVFRDQAGGDNIVWINDGSGSFTDSEQRLGGSHSWAVALGDLDGDGDPDVFDASGGSSKVWLNEGNGRFTDSNQSLGSGDSVSVGLGELDGDGDLDVFVANFDHGEPNAVFLNDGHGVFQETGQQLGQATSIGVALGDLDSDGDPDAFVANGDGGVPNAVWLNEGDGQFIHSGQLLGNSDSWSVALGDLDGDGDLDAFVGNGASIGGQANTIWLNDGGGSFSDSGLRLGSAGTRHVILVDFDGDGDLDAFAGNEDENKIWLNQSKAN